MIQLPRIARAIAILTALTAFGTMGFVLLEGLAPGEALYLSVVTISTVGYGDVAPVSNSGRWFAMALIASGVGSALYLVTLVAQDVLEGRLRDFFHRSSMMREIKKHSGHVVVCGFGRYGQVVTAEMKRVGQPVVVVECDAEREPELQACGVDYILGSAADDDALISAGIERAEAIVVATSNDATSVFITLSARELNPGLRIHARGETDQAVRRLKRAGADYVDSPYQAGGLRTAASILRPSVVDFLDLSSPESKTEIDLEEIHVSQGSRLGTESVGTVEAKYAQLRVIALKRGEQSIEVVPDATREILAGDHLVVIGERDQLLALATEALPSKA